MIKFVLLFSIFLLANTSESYGFREAPFQELADVMSNKEKYDQQKEKKILRLKDKAARLNLSLKGQIKYNQKIYLEYEKYNTDSAVTYTLRNKVLSESVKDKELHQETTIQLASLYSTKGMYVESKSLLDELASEPLRAHLIPSYYATYSAYYSHYGQSNNNYTFFHQSELYRDSLLAVLSTESTRYKISYAIKQHYSGEYEEAESLFLDLMKGREWQDPDYATVAYFLGLIYKEKEEVDLQIRYLSLSAISDLKNSVKDNASLQALALMYYELDDIDKAYVFMEAAIDDALFCGVRYRTVENSSFYPIINAAFQEKENFKKITLRKYLGLISLLSLILAIGIVYIYRQMTKLRRVRKLLHENNDKLIKLNSDLERTNSSLFDSNHIKEEYIANFFYICSTYIDKIENYRKVLFRKASLSQYEDLMDDLKSTQVVEKELIELYKNFDVIFLNLYPTFVEDFNKLLLPTEAIVPKAGDLLNPELRIFALIRLGITDSMQIATFLRYSLRTVYNYRTKVRNKSADARDELEDKVKQIAAFTSKDRK